ncbi:MAG: AAA family ATPase [Oligoflexia bacterium]|nr:AAA family ATPase [Oligoflexia bacterium]
MRATVDSFKRTVIIGNSGSGKSHLAQELAELTECDVVHFDEHFWEPGGFNKKRPPDIAQKEIHIISQAGSWIMEGVFGDLAESVLPNATALIFLDKSWCECETALFGRGSESSKQLDQITAKKNFNELLIWAKAYWERENSCSQKHHQKLFSEFKGTKLKFMSRADSENFLESLT